MYGHGPSEPDPPVLKRPPQVFTCEVCEYGSSAGWIFIRGLFFFVRCVMSVRIGDVYISPNAPAVHEKGNGGQQKMKTVAIVAPTRSNSLDYLNFEEKRKLIASSLSLSDFLAVGNNTTQEIKEGCTTVIVGELRRGDACVNNVG